MDIERRYATGSRLSTPPGPVELPGERARLEDRRQGAAAAALGRTRGQPRQARYGPATSSVSSLPDALTHAQTVNGLRATLLRSRGDAGKRALLSASSCVAWHVDRSPMAATIPSRQCPLAVSMMFRASISYIVELIGHLPQGRHI